MRSTYDPFGWRHADLTDPTLDDGYRREVLDGLIAHEAEEIAQGRHHLTVIHGEPSDPQAGCELDAFYDLLHTIAGSCQWVRIAGGVDYVTVTVAGPDATEVQARVADAARGTDPGWTILDSPHPIRPHRSSR